jgi:hypothetical protein
MPTITVIIGTNPPSPSKMSIVVGEDDVERAVVIAVADRDRDRRLADNGDRLRRTEAAVAVAEGAAAFAVAAPAAATSRCESPLKSPMSIAFGIDPEPVGIIALIGSAPVPFVARNS